MIAKNFNFITRLSQQLVQDLTNNLESAVPQLSLALDFLRPHVRALGLRVARLSRDHVELVLPAKLRNQGESGHVLEGAVVMAAVEAVKWLWKQNQPEEGFFHSVKQMQLECLRPLEGDLRLRLELPEVARESVFLQLANLKKADYQEQVLIYDRDDQMVAKVEIESKFTLTPALDWK